MNLPHLNTLVAAGESLTLELKMSTAEKDRASPTLCALANGVGVTQALVVSLLLSFQGLFSSAER
jgi:hypothetical protein